MKAEKAETERPLKDVLLHLPGLIEAGNAAKREKQECDAYLEKLAAIQKSYEKANNRLGNKVKELINRRESIESDFVESIKTGKGDRDKFNESARMVETEIECVRKEIERNNKEIERIRCELPKEPSKLKKIGMRLGDHTITKLVGMAIVDSNPIGLAASVLASEIGVKGFEGVGELNAASSRERAVAKEILCDMGVKPRFRTVSLARYHVKLGFVIDEKTLFEKRFAELAAEKERNFRYEEMLVGRYENGGISYLLNYTKFRDAADSIHNVVEGAYFNKEGKLILLTTDVAWLHHEMGYISVHGYKFDEKNLQKRFKEVFERLCERAKFEGIKIGEQGWLEEKLVMRI